MVVVGVRKTKREEEAACFSNMEEKKEFWLGQQRIDINEETLSEFQLEKSSSRPKYRSSRNPTSVCVFTVNQESQYIIVRNVPALGVLKELIEKMSIYGAIEEYRWMDEMDAQLFTDIVWIKFKDLESGRLAKLKASKESFFGNVLHISYAPEYETFQETQKKIDDRLEAVVNKFAMKKKSTTFHENTLTKSTHNDLQEFIGPISHPSSSTASAASSTASASSIRLPLAVQMPSTTPLKRRRI